VTSLTPPPAELQFPLEWHGRIIVAADAPEAVAELRSVLCAYGVSSPLTPGRASRGGRYQSYSLAIVMRNRDMLTRITASLEAVEGVKWVL